MLLVGHSRRSGEANSESGTPITDFGRRSQMALVLVSPYS
jgi:hypothetical protein